MVHSDEEQRYRSFLFCRTYTDWWNFLAMMANAAVNHDRVRTLLSCSWFSGQEVSWSLDRKWGDSQGLIPLDSFVPGLCKRHFIMMKCKMWMSYMTIVRAVECVTSKMLANTGQETEYYLDLCHTITSAHIEIDWAYKKLYEIQGLMNVLISPIHFMVEDA
jgi:hypothetical protein